MEGLPSLEGRVGSVDEGERARAEGNVGLLVFKSGFFPRILGVLLIIACFGYLVHSLTFLLFPHYEAIVSSYVAVPEAIGELSMVLWLLIKGGKDPQLDAAEARLLA